MRRACTQKSQWAWDQAKRVGLAPVATGPRTEARCATMSGVAARRREEGNSTGWMTNSASGLGGGGESGRSASRRLACEVDCQQMCRARSPGDSCLSAIQKCERACN